MAEEEEFVKRELEVAEQGIAVIERNAVHRIKEAPVLRGGAEVIAVRKESAAALERERKKSAAALERALAHMPAQKEVRGWGVVAPSACLLELID